MASPAAMKNRTDTIGTGRANAPVKRLPELPVKVLKVTVVPGVRRYKAT